MTPHERRVYDLLRRMLRYYFPEASATVRSVVVNKILDLERRGWLRCPAPEGRPSRYSPEFFRELYDPLVRRPDGELSRRYDYAKRTYAGDLEPFCEGWWVRRERGQYEPPNVIYPRNRIHTKGRIDRVPPSELALFLLAHRFGVDDQTVRNAIHRKPRRVH